MLGIYIHDLTQFSQELYVVSTGSIHVSYMGKLSLKGDILCP